MSIVTLSNQKTFKAEQDQTLLDSAKAHGLILEYSCRTGRCGACKAKVLRGTSAIKQGEQALSQEEQDAGYILTCCRVALSDLELDIEDLGQLAEIQSKTLPCRIDSIEKMAGDVMQIVLKTPPNNALNFLAGQYLDVIGKEGVRRSYSLANAPRPDGKLELHIRHVDQGVMSAYWFDQAQHNDLLRLEGPLGTFSLRNTHSNILIFLATGTGIAPVKAMLEQLAINPEQLAGKNVYIYWGGRTIADIYWQPHFDDLRVNFIPVLSRADSSWFGRTGYIQQAVLDDGLDLTAATVYACGSDTMIHSARKQLLNAGLSQKSFYSDAFVSSN
jgi:CDP-4-dehydro-6-deoxyglucose reductase